MSQHQIQVDRLLKTDITKLKKVASGLSKKVAQMERIAEHLAGQLAHSQHHNSMQKIQVSLIDLEAMFNLIGGMEWKDVAHIRGVNAQTIKIRLQQLERWVAGRICDMKRAPEDKP